MNRVERDLLPARMARLWTVKRVIDVLAASLVILLTWPLFVVAAVVVASSGSGPVLFRQRRVVEHGREITLLKFRTFPVGHADTVWSLGYDDCPSRVGRLLRRTSIDELPQLWNVLKGDLSLVGPRPERPHFAEALCEQVPGYRDRQRVPGGLTGLAQVNGYWGQTPIDQRVRLDNLYIEQWSPALDLAILLRTVGEVVRRAIRPGTAGSGLADVHAGTKLAAPIEVVPAPAPVAPD